MRNVDEQVRRRYMGDHYYKYSVTIVVKGLKVERVRILTIFTIIDLSNNKFTGEIPNVIGKLNSLRLLNLSHNDLTGNIPSLLGKSIIPNQLTTPTFLAVSNLSQNHLEGRIPQGNQFNTFQITHTMGTWRYVDFHCRINVEIIGHHNCNHHLYHTQKMIQHFLVDLI
ncbi:hypothetical protein ACSBR2_025272 [Camellia fascicularis]